MQVLIDADACPVTDIAVRMAAARGRDVVLFCDDAHVMSRTDAEVVIVMRGADSADFALVNRTRRGDIVVTQDYGLAAMCLSRGAYAVHPNGKVYDEENIVGLLSVRHEARKVRRAGGRTKGPKPRSAQMDEAFVQAYGALLEKQDAGPQG